MVAALANPDWIAAVEAIRKKPTNHPMDRSGGSAASWWKIYLPPFGHRGRYSAMQMNERQRIAFGDWIGGTIDDETFSTAYGMLANGWPAEVSRLLDAAAAAKNADVLEYATHLHARFCPQMDLSSWFYVLVTQTWHYSHEYMIRYFQDHPSEANVAPLRDAIALKPTLEYLDYDDYGGYYKKCMWALAVNPSSSANDLIKECATSKDDVLREQAVYRLRRLGVQNDES